LFYIKKEETSKQFPLNLHFLAVFTKFYIVLFNLFYLKKEETSKQFSLNLHFLAVWTKFDTIINSFYLKKSKCSDQIKTLIYGYIK